MATCWHFTPPVGLNQRYQAAARAAAGPPVASAGCCPLSHRTSSRRIFASNCRASSAPFRESSESQDASTPTAVPTTLVTPQLPSTSAPARSTKTRIVVLGSGWGASAFVKNVDPAVVGENGQYELMLVSPRNYMLYTPLLPSAVGGVVSENSIVESIRALMRGKGIYYEARAVDIDLVKRELTCIKEFCEVCAMRTGLGHTEVDHTFTIPYDILLCSVGAINATFGIPGVVENCWFLKSMEDAHKLRRHISKVLEHAALPDVSLEERRRLLSFVVVGGGPTGVEVAAELDDLVKQDVARHLPHIKDDMTINLIDGQDSLLTSYDKEIQSYAARVFERSGIRCRLGASVTAVRPGFIEVKLKDGSRDTVPFNTCVWATGIAMHPLVAGIKCKLPNEIQDSRRGLLVDKHLRVLGSQGTIFCLGDAAVTGSMPQTSLPPTAQVARQEGKYLAALFSKHALALDEKAEQAGGDLVQMPRYARAFSYLHLGALAYLGGHRAVMDLPVKLPGLRTLRGYLGGQAWRSLETYMQVSPRTRWLVLMDWVRWWVFGRNISDI